MQTAFIKENFLLQNKYAVDLYHNYAADMPIIDYHNHLSPQAIAEDRQFDNITQVCLYEDHYKWRAMRAFGIDEYFITGDATDWEKFEKWAETVPHTMRNPLYHWTHLELKRYFDIDKLLSPETAKEIYDTCNNLLQKKEFSVIGLLKKMNVKTVCTTDDPTDDLVFHQSIHNQNHGLQVFPTFRPDQLLVTDEPDQLAAYINKLEKTANSEVRSIDDLLQVLRARLDYFVSNGCLLSDHGLNQVPAVEYAYVEVNKIFTNWRKGILGFSADHLLQFKSLLLHELGLMYHQRGIIMQLHLGAIRNNNRRLKDKIGADVGCDSIGDYEQAPSLSKFLNALDWKNKLPKTILYNLNPGDNEVFATMAGNFQDGSSKGKIQWGSAWWFLDQKEGMEKQINTLSGMGLLSQFVGMLTDSRSFLSYPRHEYFRRILCNIIGQDIQEGLLPANIPWLGKMVQDICYFNAKKYFKI